MKLVYYTYRKISLLLFVLMAVWGVLFYYAIIDEVVDETDDTLENYAEILIEHVLHDSSLLETEGSLMSFINSVPSLNRREIIIRKFFMTLPCISNLRTRTNRYA